MPGMPDVIEKFPETSLHRMLIEMRWPAVFSCPLCRSNETPKVWSRQLLHCRACGKSVRVTTGTIFEGSHVSLETWVAVIKAMTGNDDPVSASQIYRELNREPGIRDKFVMRDKPVIRDKTVMDMLNKLRRLMQQEQRRNRLSGRIQVDELLLPYALGHVPGAGDGTAIIFIAVELRDINELGRVSLHTISDFEPLSLVPSVQSVAKKGAIVETDGLGPYKVLKEAEYVHRIVRAQASAGTDLLPACQILAEKVIRWLGEVYGSGMSRRNLDLYLAEFAFRLSRTGPRARMHRLDDLLKLALRNGVSATQPDDPPV